MYTIDLKRKYLQLIFLIKAYIIINWRMFLGQIIIVSTLPGPFLIHDLSPGL